MKALTFLFIIVSWFATAQTESLFWKIEHPDIKKSSYLFGTYHLMNASFLDEDATAVKKKFQKATTILVESRESEMTDQTLLDRYFSEGPSISASLTPEEIALIDSITTLTVQTPLEYFDHMKPLMLAIFVGLTHHQEYIRDSSSFTGDPIDIYFDMYATNRSVPVFSLESPEESFAYSMDSISFEDQLEYLVENCKHDNEMYSIAGRMYESYKANNVPELLNAVDYYNTLVPDVSSEYITEKRNKLWMPRLLKELDKGNVFVAVGSLHLVYDYGLVTLLRNEGFTLTPLQLK